MDDLLSASRPESVPGTVAAARSVWTAGITDTLVSTRLRHRESDASSAGGSAGPGRRVTMRSGRSSWT